jgi:NADH:ubiquinone oxidoreductase subunit
MFRQIKEGRQVGVDRQGNKYYENLDLPYGQHRWVEPAKYESPQLWDASNIPPEWHGWMHYTTDRVPESSPLPTGRAIAQHSDVSKDMESHVVPEAVRDGQWRPNQTLNRERGYGIKNYYQNQVGGNGFYIQPGNVASPLHKEYVPKVFENAWSPPAGLMKKKPEPPTKFQRFRAERDAMNKAEQMNAVASKKEAKQ